jgi:hypothetical protein
MPRVEPDRRVPRYVPFVADAGPVWPLDRVNPRIGRANEVTARGAAPGALRLGRHLQTVSHLLGRWMPARLARLVRRPSLRPGKGLPERRPPGSVALRPAALTSPAETRTPPATASSCTGTRPRTAPQIEQFRTDQQRATCPRRVALVGCSISSAVSGCASSSSSSPPSSCTKVKRTPASHRPPWGSGGSRYQRRRARRR